MSNDAAIRDAVLSCGVPNAALSKTLPLLGQAALREHVMGEEWRKRHDARSLFLYPQNVKARSNARRVFHVMAKEFVLVGADIQLVSVARLVRNVLGKEDEYEENLAYRVRNAEVVLVSDFYDLAFRKNPHTDEQQYEFYNWLVDAWTAGKVTYFLADATVQKCTPWWDETFLMQIEEHVTPYEVAGAV
jgi:hypothetical protein